ALRVSVSGLPLLDQLDAAIKAVLGHNLVPVLGQVLGALDENPDDSTLDLGGVHSCSTLDDLVVAPVAQLDPERFCVIHLSPEAIDVLGKLDQALGVDVDTLLAAPLLDELLGHLDSVLLGLTGPLGPALGALLGADWPIELVGTLDLTTLTGALRSNLL